MLSATGRLTWNLLLALAFGGSLAYILFNPLTTSLSSAFYLQAGEMLLEGQTPYVDFVDVNPPLIIYFSALWAGAAKLLGLHPITTILLGVWLLSVMSALATRGILRAAFAPDEGYHADLLAMALALGLLYVLMPHKGVGEREHLFIIAFFPYLAIRFRRWRSGASTRFASGRRFALWSRGVFETPLRRDRSRSRALLDSDTTPYSTALRTRDLCASGCGSWLRGPLPVVA